MPQLQYLRDDFTIRIKYAGNEGIDLYFPAAASPRRIPRSTADGWFTSIPDAGELAAVIGPIPGLQAWLDTPPRIESSGTPRAFLRRVVLDIPYSVVAGFPWEQAIAPALPSYERLLVRTTPVLPRYGEDPFTLPMRILQVGTGGVVSIEEIIHLVFGGRPRATVDQAVIAGACTFEEIESWRAASGWPTAEVLHFDAFPFVTNFLTTADPERAGTLGWLSRLTSTWQTRLVVLHCDRNRTEVFMRMLASELVGRGGPAVLVGDLGGVPASPYYESLYSDLVHDAPLDDAAFPNLLQGGFGTERRPSLVVGGGREEALRFSTLGRELVDLGRELRRGVEGAPAEVAAMEGLLLRTGREAVFGMDRETGLTGASAMSEVQRELDVLSNNWEKLSFEFHEREGVLPLAEHVQALRRAAGVVGAALPSEIAPSPDPGRFVNPQITQPGSDGQRKAIPQAGPELRVGETYQLQIDIGPQDATVRVVGTVALLEEHFEWTPDTLGVWLEIGVTEIDFEVLGDPVQEVWLPRNGPSARAIFAIVPHVTGVAQLRFCVYHRNNVIQSFRLAANVGGPTRSEMPDAERATLLARALELPEEMVTETAWLARIEYALVPGVDEAESQPPRELSIVANALNGRTIVTVKGHGRFSVRKDIGDAASLVTRVRARLREVSEEPLEETSEEATEEASEEPLEQTNTVKMKYHFGLPGRRNAGDETRLKPALMKLAEIGYELFDRVFPGDEAYRAEALGKLPVEGDAIHVAQIQLPKVIPWAAMYLRPYDADQQDAMVDNAIHPVAHDACLAALPGADGAFPTAHCGELESCVLHQARVAERLAATREIVVPSTVACPRFFLGFRHIVEIPPKQVQPRDTEKTSPGSSRTRPVERAYSEIGVSGSARLAAGFHTNLKLVQPHEQALGKLFKGPPVRAIPAPTAYSRDDVLRLLEDRALDIIYFFCHARGGPDTDVDPPVLEFQPKGGRLGSFHSAQVPRVTWAHHPLVILNGCNTVGFSPNTLSPFIQKFVHDCKASGVIGTEIPVYEELASEFAELFLERFLAGEAAGSALLQTRRAFLAQYNPLGLVYTLYAAADLRIVPEAPPAELRTASADLDVVGRTEAELAHWHRSVARQEDGQRSERQSH